MFSFRSTLSTRFILAAACLGMAVAPGVGHAVGDPAAKSDGDKVLRICASTQNAPFSRSDASGFEDKIMTVVADAMGLKPVFVWSNRPQIYAVQEQLDKNQCDVVMGVDSGDTRVLTTVPVYRAGYVFITRADHDAITGFDDPKLKTAGHIAMSLHSPAQPVMVKEKIYYNNVPYLYSLIGFHSPRNQYADVSPDKIVSEVASGNAGVGIAFEPEVARYVHESNVKLRVTPIEDNQTGSDGRAIPQRFDEAMGVRKDDAPLRDALNKAIDASRSKIDAILHEEGFVSYPLNS
ncbi:methanol oxidation system protein MoxJ [Acidomonas methanolica]|uniref:Extracellular solute-binding protein n=2 Tax=Acidomonas methanolica TaxID=437 RepID=A0A023D517_ACIMT|nr:methanol oxidation system protein MoxJ [Acidomonas methanolica]MBU2655467.1 methanol oxidation system protein MoxJ [Acidomonas methanolica]TCS24453.1 amino acid ABC transporter substrate-binding protein (PAAT family) [Acidomonas methanolica]BAN85788.1 MxaJ protein precursor [Acidomonas methanolica]GAJ29248.1 extracellular solute-binding protein [Acidomonas methanolica NBRC 104435]GEK99875.1 methanol oxidation protein [Acidomonas methanolica NBRC 104435]